jgi:hypothetical protein
MKEWQRTDVQGLAVINHQKFACLGQRAQGSFSEDVLTNAQEQVRFADDVGSLQISRSYLKLGWKHEHIEALIYKNGVSTF